jgi:aspartyl-tRNA(Asn)/glutamyl-tRNA(Gln) amidotransferase subunit A
MNDLSDLTLAQAAARLRERTVSPVELTQAYLHRIDQHDKGIGSYLLVMSDAAREQAQAAERALLRGEWRGALHGIPIALKDLYEVQGYRTTAGSRFLRNHISPATATVIEKLKAAGAIILGKLNMHEWALGVIGDNPHYGLCRNPWDRERICGGSSSGSGAAVASRLCVAALGSDTRGSVRIPAALCGVVGLKPTYGRVSLNGVFPLSWTLDHGGPLTRNVEDAAHLLAAMAGYDPNDPYSVAHPVDDYLATLREGVRGMRVAVDVGDFTSDSEVVDVEVRHAYHQAIAVFRHLGAVVEEVDLTFLLNVTKSSRQITAADAAAFHEMRLLTAPEDFGEDVLARLRHDPPPTASLVSGLRHQHAIFKRQMERFFGSYDLLLLPTVPMPAVRRDDPARIDKGRTTYSRFTSPFNVAGVPALSVPCGMHAEGVPLGLQIVAGHWQESLLLRAGYAYEQAAEWHQRRPALS